MMTCGDGEYRTNTGACAKCSGTLNTLSVEATVNFTINGVSREYTITPESNSCTTTE